MTKIVMTGPTGVGKTSLLAAMYPHLEKHFPGNGYSLVPEPNTKQLLDELAEKLKKLGEGGTKVTDKQIAGTPQAQEFNFDLVYDNGDTRVTDVNLQIWDIPGAFCTSNNGLQAQEYLRGSDVSFWCIDSVALMKGNNEAVNAPTTMANVIANSKLNKGHSVCLVLMRSETWEHNGKMGDLFTQLRHQFGSAAATLHGNPNIGKVYYCSVQTTGNLHFNSYEGTEPVFIRNAAGAGYAPKHCELPVLCAVRQSLESVIEAARREIKRIIDECFPFTRRCPLMPGHFSYKRNKGLAERLAKRLAQVSKDVERCLQAEEKSQRLFRW
ncbi:MAG: ATP-binding protein [Planctomycetaceae bacterium]|jgi:GTPase SAR1 family protein|nr:ATP-binding protein [Planctomycetaceae bacterium]